MSLPESLTLQLTSSVSLELRLIPAGEFRMGSRGYEENEEPIHLVRITQPFYLGATPVTQAQWRAVAESHPDSGLNADPSYCKGDTRPVEYVSWDDCSAWFRLLNERGDLASRLWDQQNQHPGLANPQIDFPSEAQWEYACRLMRDSAGQPYAVETEYYTGDGEAALGVAGWYSGNSGSETHPIADRDLRPTDFGLYDMHGNVWEWCRDGWDADAYKKRMDGVADPIVEPQSSHAFPVIRGGGWIDSPWNCRAACRHRWRPDYRYRFQGFRVSFLFGPGSCRASAGSETGAEGDLRTSKLPLRSGEKF